MPSRPSWTPSLWEPPWASPPAEMGGSRGLWSTRRAGCPCTSEIQCSPTSALLPPLHSRLSHSKCIEPHEKTYETEKKKAAKQRGRRNGTLLVFVGSRAQSVAWNKKKKRKKREKKEKKPLHEWVFFSIVVHDHNLAMHLLATVIIKQALTINKKTMKMKVLKWKWITASPQQKTSFWRKTD